MVATPLSGTPETPFPVDHTPLVHGMGADGRTCLWKYSYKLFVFDTWSSTDSGKWLQAFENLGTGHALWDEIIWLKSIFITLAILSYALLLNYLLPTVVSGFDSIELIVSGSIFIAPISKQEELWTQLENHQSRQAMSQGLIQPSVPPANNNFSLPNGLSLVVKPMFSLPAKNATNQVNINVNVNVNG